MLHRGQGAQINSDGRHTRYRIEYSGLDPRTNRWLREPEHACSFGDFDPAVASCQPVPHRVERAAAVGIVLMVRELLKGDEVIHDFGE